MAAASPRETTFKLLLVGESNTGKSSLIMRFTDNVFDEDLSATIGVDFKVKQMFLNDTTIKLTIWDTAGQERFRTLTSSFYRGAHGVIFVYDVTRRETFDTALDTWLTEVDTYATNDVVKMLIGNKIDQTEERQVSRAEGLAFAQRHSMLFIECSARTRVGVEQAFEELVQKMYDTPALWRTGPTNNVQLGGAEEAPALDQGCGYC
ncbi:GTP-binding protein yptV3 [Capsaspora owczarzaki ATCC 30864]|uniref:GTP-binding protein yptV3 n=1 Tax=Capsaspora owczarzaki (strain ATCC 30864) TaxID=595528 RepID=A0A0D2U7U3_CAPO3|nr:GTP-binding protein yptV3 [Capsaspora owczarzaki ATCC 30864]KJE91151.1 GTP-binding protein yptV3 [Capsaspora owczarzaki ATCC 30864]|eukprot:XP_004349079.1 GTP-binding protein yptV3 [Capsaspora owczarzaki ATCC 30864]